MSWKFKPKCFVTVLTKTGISKSTWFCILYCINKLCTCFPFNLGWWAMGLTSMYRYSQYVQLVYGTDNNKHSCTVSLASMLYPNTLDEHDTLKGWYLPGCSELKTDFREEAWRQESQKYMKPPGRLWIEWSEITHHVLVSQMDLNSPDHEYTIKPLHKFIGAQVYSRRMNKKLLTS